MKSGKDTVCGGSITKWFRLLDLKSEGPWFKQSTLLLTSFFSVVPNSTPQLHCVHCKQPPGQPPTSWDSQQFVFYLQYLFIYFIYNIPNQNSDKYIKHLKTKLIFVVVFYLLASLINSASCFCSKLLVSSLNCHTSKGKEKTK